MRATIRLAILEADRPLDHTAAKYGSLGGVFRALFQAAAEKLGLADGDLDITVWDVAGTEMFPDVKDVDAVLISGSRANAFDNTPWILKLVEFTKRLLREQSGVKVIGVCFGHQIIGRALGVKVERNEKGWEGSVLPIKLSSTGKELFGLDVLNIFQMHHDILLELPQGVSNLGQTPACAIHGLYDPRRLISVQGHPEYTSEIVSEVLDNRRKKGIFSEEMYWNMVGRVNKRHDGVAVGIAFIKFLQEG